MQRLENRVFNFVFLNFVGDVAVGVDTFEGLANGGGEYSLHKLRGVCWGTTRHHIIYNSDGGVYRNLCDSETAL